MNSSSLFLSKHSLIVYRQSIVCSCIVPVPLLVFTCVSVFFLLGASAVLNSGSTPVWSSFNLITSLKTAFPNKVTFWGTRVKDFNISLLLFSCSVVSNSLWSHEAYLSFINCQGLLKFTSTELMMPSNHGILYCPLLLLPSMFPSFSNKSALCIRWSKYWSFNFSTFLVGGHNSVIAMAYKKY